MDMSAESPSRRSPGTLVPEAERRRIAAKYRIQEAAVLERRHLGKAGMERGFALLNQALARDGIRATVNLAGGQSCSWCTMCGR